MDNLDNPIYKPSDKNETNQAKFRKPVGSHHCQRAFFVLKLLSLVGKLKLLLRPLISHASTHLLHPPITQGLLWSFVVETVTCSKATGNGKNQFDFTLIGEPVPPSHRNPTFQGGSRKSVRLFQNFWDSILTLNIPAVFSQHEEDPPRSL